MLACIGGTKLPEKAAGIRHRLHPARRVRRARRKYQSKPILRRARRIVQALAACQENLPQKARKLLSRFGAVRNSAMSALVQASQWCHPPSWIQPTSGTAYTDPTNAVYLAVFHGMSPRLPWVLLQLGEEKAGDVCEAALGAAYLLLEDDVAPRQLEEQEASALREMRRLLEERVNAQLEVNLGVRRRFEEVW